MMDVWRIEHKDSGLGPFTHDDQNSLDLNSVLNIKRGMMADLDDVQCVKQALVTGCVRYGYNSELGCLRIVKNITKLNKGGFYIKNYRVDQKDIIYVHEDDGQVVFVV